MKEVQEALSKLRVVAETKRINSTQREALNDAIKLLVSIKSEEKGLPWIDFNSTDFDTRPSRDGRYLVELHDGKIVMNDWVNRRWRAHSNVKRYCFISK